MPRIYVRTQNDHTGLGRRLGAPKCFFMKKLIFAQKSLDTNPVWREGLEPELIQEESYPAVKWQEHENVFDGSDCIVKTVLFIANRILASVTPNFRSLAHCTSAKIIDKNASVTTETLGVPNWKQESIFLAEAQVKMKGIQKCWTKRIRASWNLRCQSPPTATESFPSVWSKVCSGILHTCEKVYHRLLWRIIQLKREQGGIGGSTKPMGGGLPICSLS